MPSGKKITCKIRLCIQCHFSLSVCLLVDVYFHLALHIQQNNGSFAKPIGIGRKFEISLGQTLSLPRINVYTDLHVNRDTQHALQLQPPVTVKSICSDLKCLQIIPICLENCQCGPDRCVNKRDFNQRNFIEGRHLQKVGPFLFSRNGIFPFMLFTCVQFRPL